MIAIIFKAVDIIIRMLMLILIAFIAVMYFMYSKYNFEILLYLMLFFMIMELGDIRRAVSSK